MKSKYNELSDPMQKYIDEFVLLMDTNIEQAQKVAKNNLIEAGILKGKLSEIPLALADGMNDRE